MEERQYDLIFICQPDTPESEIDKIIATLESTATEKGAKVEKVDKWGRKRMAYRVKKLREGIYVLMVLKSGNGEVIKELERRLKVPGAVIKYKTLGTDEELKRQENLKKHRDRRAARRPRKTAPAAAPAAPSAPS